MFQVREVKAQEEEIKQVRRKLENFDRYASSGNLAKQTQGKKSKVAGSTPDLSCFEKDFECSVCLEEMKPPVKIFQCRNGHVMCEACSEHPEVARCPSCRIPIANRQLMRNIPMEKLARSYYEGGVNCAGAREAACPSPSASARAEPLAVALAQRNLFMSGRARRGSGGHSEGGAGGLGQARGVASSGLSSSVNDVSSYLDWLP